MTKRITFIDSRVADYQTLIADLPADTEWFVLNTEEDGLEQMANILSGYSELDAIDVISHGSVGTLYLGNTLLDNTNLAKYQDQLKLIGTSLCETGDILLYGCNVAQGETGLRFISSLVQYTGADIAASDDITGGGLTSNWNLEQKQGAIETQPFVLEGYPNTLLWESEPNGTMNTADQLSIGVEITGQFATISDIEWYSISLPSSGTLSAFLDVYRPGSRSEGSTGIPREYWGYNIAFSYFNSKSELLSSYTTTYDNTFQTGIVASGTYYIEVKKTSSTQDTSPYHLTLSFASDDVTPPIVSSFSPYDEASGVSVGNNIVLTFSEPIQRGTGNIVLKTATGVVIAAHEASTSTNLSILNNTLTVAQSEPLNYSTEYKVEFASGSIKDLSGNNYAGTSIYNFTTIADPVNQRFTGNASNEFFEGGTGNDVIDGSGGIDTATYSFGRGSYAVAITASGFTVTANSGTEGTDTLTNIERLQFSDKTVNLTIQDIAAAAPHADVQRLEELYVAFFNRVPDADGLAYWIGQMNAGQSINQIAESFYNAGVQYSSLTGFSSGMSNADFVNVVYSNVLGRSDGADAGGLAYWTGELDSGHATHGTLVSTILSSAHTYKGDATWGWVADLLDNKITVANQFAVDWGLNYNTPSESIPQGMAIAAAVTPTSTTAAIALIGVSATDMEIA